MNIHERIRHLRKNELKMTQQVFSSRLNISRSNMGNIETGSVAVTDRIIFSICKEFDVNENWIRTGSGDIFLSKSRNQMIIDFAGDIIKDNDESFRKRLLEALAQLEPEEWAVLETIAKKATKKD